MEQKRQRTESGRTGKRTQREHYGSGHGRPLTEHIVMKTEQSGERSERNGNGMEYGDGMEQERNGIGNGTTRTERHRNGQ